VATWAWVLIGIAIAVVVVALVGMALRERRTARLRARFGAEYDRATEERQGRRAAESDLRNRQKQRAKLNITSLPEPARARYAEQWRELQERFIDQPSSAVIAADVLVRQVMGDEGYPVDDFARQADLVSVDHPRVVENYRTAHGVCERTQTHQASTEDMRTALLSYRSLFDELLATSPDGAGGGDADMGSTPGGEAMRGQHRQQDTDQEGRR
jgi:hypothetical protein